MQLDNPPSCCYLLTVFALRHRQPSDRVAQVLEFQIDGDATRKPEIAHILRSHRLVSAVAAQPVVVFGPIGGGDGVVIVGRRNVRVGVGARGIVAQATAERCRACVFGERHFSGIRVCACVTGLATLMHSSSTTFSCNWLAGSELTLLIMTLVIQNSEVACMSDAIKSMLSVSDVQLKAHNCVNVQQPCRYAG